MRISGLIAELEKVKAERGNLQLRVADYYSGISEVYGVRLKINDRDDHKWYTDDDLGDGEVYVFID